MKESSYRFGVIFIGDREDLRNIRDAIEMLPEDNRCQILKEVFTRNRVDFREFNVPLDEEY